MTFRDFSWMGIRWYYVFFIGSETGNKRLCDSKRSRNDGRLKCAKDKCPPCPEQKFCWENMTYDCFYRVVDTWENLNLLPGEVINPGMSFYVNWFLKITNTRLSLGCRVNRKELNTFQLPSLSKLFLWSSCVSPTGTCYENSIMFALFF